MTQYYFYTALVAAGIVFDIYFCYVIYSCYKLGIRGDLRGEIAEAFGNNHRVAPNHSDVHMIGIDNSQAIFRAVGIKEVVAYPQEDLKVCETYEIPIHDFTNILKK